MNRYFKFSPPRSIPHNLCACIMVCSKLLENIRSKAYVNPSGLLNHLDGRIPVRLGIPLWYSGQKRPMAPVHEVCDNTTAVNIVRRGGSRSALLNNIMYDIVK